MLLIATAEVLVEGISVMFPVFIFNYSAHHITVNLRLSKEVVIGSNHPKKIQDWQAKHISDKMSDKEKKDSTRKKCSTTDEEESIEDFMKKIDEHHKQLNIEEKYENESDTTNYDMDEREVEIDNLLQDMELLKEELNMERAKVKSLTEVVNQQSKVIHTLQKKDKSETSNTRSKKVKCRYWNRGFCKNGNDCKFHHYEKDCETYLKTETCEDRKCKKRHRKLCRYFQSKEGCYRNEACQYLHELTTNDNKTKKNQTNEDNCSNSFECKKCDFNCNRETTLKKHINTKHSRKLSEDQVSEFIFRLGCEDYATEYKTYFQKYGFIKKETDYAKRMIKSYGPEFILEDLQ